MNWCPALRGRLGRDRAVGGLRAGARRERGGAAGACGADCVAEVEAVDGTTEIPALGVRCVREWG